MKRLLLIAVLVLGVVAGVFFVDTAPHVPLAASLVRITNSSNGGVQVTFSLTNRTDQRYQCTFRHQSWVEGSWSPPEKGSEPPAITLYLPPHVSKEGRLVVNSPTERQRILFYFKKSATPFQLKVDAAFRKCHLPEPFGSSRWRPLNQSSVEYSVH